MNDHILYSFRRCPFAIRARWMIALCGISIIIREIDLKNKPEELLEISPKGTVPVLLTSNQEIIQESIEIMNWAINNAKTNRNLIDKLSTDNCQEVKEYILTNDTRFKFHLDRYKYTNRYEEVDAEYHRTQAKKILVKLSNQIDANSSNSTGWLLGKEESLADLAIWPFVRQYRITNPKYFDEDLELTHLKKWLFRYLNNPLFLYVMQKYSLWDKDQNDNIFNYRT